MTRRDRITLAARLLVTLALAGLLVWQLDLGQSLRRVPDCDPALLSLAVAAIFLAIVLSAWKWGLLLAARGHALPFGSLLRLYFVGLFFNNVLPTSVGGDVVRAWEATRETGEVPETVGSVVSERLIAGAALGFTALLGLPFVPAGSQPLLLVLVFLAINLSLVALFVVPRLAEGAVGSVLPRQFHAVRGTLTGTVLAVRATLRQPALVVRVFLLSIAFQVCVAAVNSALFLALGIEVGLAESLIYTPMIFTVAMLPISISGLGVREAAYAWFFAQIGVAQADAVLVSLLFFVLVALCSLPGAPLFVLRRRLRAGALSA